MTRTIAILRCPGRLSLVRREGIVNGCVDLQPGRLSRLSQRASDLADVARYPEIDSPTSKCGFQLDQHRCRTHIDEGAGLGVENDDLGLVRAECLNLRLDVVCVGKHQPGLDSDHDRVWTRRQIGMPVGV
jgi:hypothetical protein